MYNFCIEDDEYQPAFANVVIVCGFAPCTFFSESVNKFFNRTLGTWSLNLILPFCVSVKRVSVLLEKRKMSADLFKLPPRFLRKMKVGHSIIKNSQLDKK